MNEITGEEQSIRTMTVACVPEDLFRVACYSRLQISEALVWDLDEAIARANYGLRVGKFELDFDDGEPRFQVSQILDGEAVGPAVIDRMIGTAVNMMETYLPAFLAVVYGNEEAGDAIRRVEAGWCGREDE